MAPRDGTGPDHLTHLARLTANPEQHHIFHAFRIIEAAYNDAPRLGESIRPREEVVRFGQEAELSFPPSTIRSFTPPVKSGDKIKPGRLTNRFFGLFGPHGPLPIHLTEFARDRQRNHRDGTFVAFADMLTHRLMTLFYRAWASAQPSPSFDTRRGDVFAKKVAAIGGMHGKHLQDRDAFPDLAKKHFAGLLAQGPKNADGLILILKAFFDAPVEIEEFVGSWLELEPDDRWALGTPAGLGRATSVGSKVWTRGAKFRLKIGPLSCGEYERMLPGTQSLERLHAIVRSYAGDTLDFDVNLVLRAEEVPQAVLGKNARLGQLGWIGTRKQSGDAADLYLSADIIKQARVADTALAA